MFSSNSVVDTIFHGDPVADITKLSLRLLAGPDGPDDVAAVATTRMDNIVMVIPFI